ncbi:MAG: hypothetical protein OXT69_03825 [Candidatus Poribacteria bacterium]|nr:hypothetical protein [Candidatus Poribacteria bacterium]
MKTSHIVRVLAALCAAVCLFFLLQLMRKDEPAPPQETAAAPLNSDTSAESEAGTGVSDPAQDAAATAVLYMELPEILQRMEDGSLTEADYARMGEIDAALYPGSPGTLEQWLRELTSEGKRSRDAEEAESILSDMRSIASSIQSVENVYMPYAQAAVEKAAQIGSEELAAAAQKYLQAAQKYLAAEKKRLDATADKLPVLKVKGPFKRAEARAAARTKRSQMFKEASAALKEMLSAETEYDRVRDVVEARSNWIESAENLSAAAENDQQRAAAARLLAAGQKAVSYKEGLLAKVRRGEELTTADLEQGWPLSENAMRIDYEAHMLFKRQGVRLWWLASSLEAKQKALAAEKKLLDAIAD